jgi:pilus assembly protein Flp/PilA
MPSRHIICEATNVKSCVSGKATPVKKIIKRFLVDESGATAIEYGLIAAGISLAIITVINGMGTKLSSKFTSINASLH